MRVSIALATRNGGRFLQRQLDSLAAQERRPDEIVVGDDASGDDTLAILRQFAETSGLDVKVQANDPPLGVSANFESCLRRCTGDVIFPCDQDDVWHTGKVRRMAALFERDERVTVALAPSRVVDEAGAATGREQPADFARRFARPLSREGDYRVLVRQPSVPGHATAVRASALRVALPLSGTASWDAWLIPAAATVGRAACVGEPLVDYRRHASQAIGADTAGLLKQAMGQKRLKLDHLQRNRDAAALLADRVREHRELVADAEAKLAWLEGRVRYFDRRLSMRGGRVRRVGLVLAMLASGAYRRYGRGVLTAGRDLRGS